MKVLVIGSGGREHALAWKIGQSPLVDQVFCAPGNGGTALEPKITNVDIGAGDIDSLLKVAIEKDIELTVVGPEQPLVDGIVDRFVAEGRAIFGPSGAAARLEGSKVYAKEIMHSAGVPTAGHVCFDEVDAAREHIAKAAYPLVIKADGLAAGKGVAVCHDRQTAEKFLQRLSSEGNLKAAANKILVEDYLDGVELSVIGLCNGLQFELLSPARDYKRLGDGGKGPNTGGMGAFTPVEGVDAKLMKKVKERIFAPLLKTMQVKQAEFKGVLYAGLMIVESEPYVLEFNVRFGDPETQPLLFHLKSDLVPKLLAIANGGFDESPSEWKSGASMCVVLASSGYPGNYEKGVPLPESVKDTSGAVKIFHAGTKASDGGLVTAGGRVLSATANANSLNEVRQEIYGQIRRWSFAGAQYRSDVGS